MVQRFENSFERSAPLRSILTKNFALSRVAFQPLSISGSDARAADGGDRKTDVAVSRQPGLAFGDVACTQKLRARLIFRRRSRFAWTFVVGRHVAVAGRIACFYVSIQSRHDRAGVARSGGKKRATRNCYSAYLAVVVSVSKTVTSFTRTRPLVVLLKRVLVSS
jgi:hypothetical protein